MTAHPDNANMPPMTEQERRDHYSDGPPGSDPNDQCVGCAAWRIDVWDGTEAEGWTITEEGFGYCAQCKRKDEQAAAAVTLGEENCGGGPVAPGSEVGGACNTDRLSR